MIERTYFVYLHRRNDTGEVFYVGKGTRTPLKRYIRSTTTSRRNQYWRRVVERSGGFDALVLADFFVEADAFAFESELIAAYGHQRAGGTLCNLTDGGEGHAGLSPSPQTREKMALAHRGRPKPEHVKAAVSAAQRGVPNPEWQNIEHSRRMTGSGHPKFGKKDSDETCAKRSASMKGKLAGEKHPFYGTKRPQHVVEVLREKQRRAVVDRLTGTVYPSVGHAAQAIGKADSTVSRWLRGVRPNPTTLKFA